MTHPHISDEHLAKINAKRKQAGRPEMTRYQAESHVTAAPSVGDWTMFLILLDSITAPAAAPEHDGPVHDLGRVDFDVSQSGGGFGGAGASGSFDAGTGNGGNTGGDSSSSDSGSGGNTGGDSSSSDSGSGGGGGDSGGGGGE